MFEQIWQWVATAFTNRDWANLFCLIDGMFFYSWYMANVSDGKKDMREMVRTILGAIIIGFILFGLSFIWVGFPLIVVIFCAVMWFNILFDLLKTHTRISS